MTANTNYFIIGKDDEDFSLNAQKLFKTDEQALAVLAELKDNPIHAPEAQQCKVFHVKVLGEVQA